MESAIIDSDHWRHYFLVLGVLWGLIGASRSYRIRSVGQLRTQVPLAHHG
jgi:hypothetical protein